MPAFRNTVMELAALLRAGLPDARVKVDSAAEPFGSWLVVVQRGVRTVILQGKPTTFEFGVWAVGTPADGTVVGMDDAVEVVAGLLP